MKKSEIRDRLLEIKYTLQNYAEKGTGMTENETKELYNEIFYLCQQLSF
jgi:hypothetical protein